MSPMSRPHSLAIVKTADTLEAAFGNNAAVEDQMPIHLESGSEPVPDVIILRGSSQDYLEVPRPSDVLLLVEVSYSTLTYDRNTKAKIYAENGVAEYWIVNLRSRALEVYRQPEDSEYISLRVYDETAAVAPLAAPDALVRVADLLPIARG
jgi:Uma2 family endonuclease